MLNTHSTYLNEPAILQGYFYPIWIDLKGEYPARASLYQASSLDRQTLLPHLD